MHNRANSFKASSLPAEDEEVAWQQKQLFRPPLGTTWVNLKAPNLSVLLAVEIKVPREEILEGRETYCERLKQLTAAEVAEWHYFRFRLRPLLGAWPLIETYHGCYLGHDLRGHAYYWEGLRVAQEVAGPQSLGSSLKKCNYKIVAKKN